MGKLLSAIRETGKLFTSQRRLWIPFLVVAVIELLVTFLVWIAPQEPFAKLLAPPIRYFFSDRVLHYPAHLWFLYHSMKHAQLVAMTLVGAYMTGLACLMVQQVHEKQPISLYQAIKSKRVKYGRVLIIWVIAWSLARALAEFLPVYLPKTHWLAATMLVVLIVFQALFLFAIPVAVLQGANWWRSLLRSLFLAIRYPFSSLTIVTICAIPLIFIGYFLSSESMAKVVFQTIPELVFVFIFIRLTIWTVADTFISIAAAHFWMLTEGERIKRASRAGYTDGSLSSGEK